MSGLRHTLNIMLAKHKMSRMKMVIASVASAVATFGLALVASAQTPFSTSTLGTAIDKVSGTSYDYFGVLIDRFWPFLLGAVILVGVVVFGKRIIHSLFGR